MYRLYRDSCYICKFREGLFVKGIGEKELVLLTSFFERNPPRTPKNITTIHTLIPLSPICFSEFLNRSPLTFLTNFIHRIKIEQINRSIMPETHEKTYQKMSIKPIFSMCLETKRNLIIPVWAGIHVRA